MIVLITELAYLFATISFITGLKFMSSPKRAPLGNKIAAAGMTMAVVVTIAYAIYNGIGMLPLILVVVAILAGILLGHQTAKSVQMTAMPQLVSLFNAMGGGCALLIGLAEAIRYPGIHPLETVKITILAGMVVGAISLSGSIVSFLKLAGKMGDHKNVVINITGLVLLLSTIVLAVLACINPYFTGMPFLVLLIGVSLAYGIVFVVPIGGADMPVVISLLNSLTGIAAGLAGFIYQNKAMLSGGILVGAAGFVLTMMMCKSMNRPLSNVLAGSFSKRKTQQKNTGPGGNIRETTITDAATLLGYAEHVAIIPGYGLAVAQAQHACRQVEKILEERGVTVRYIIHPVAGRMPGHMNVLLAESDVPYENLMEMEATNDLMETFDVAVVIGANDVVNPAAENDPSSPIYGMPIIRAHKAKKVIVIKRSMNKGYAGIENDLFLHPNTTLLFADAKTALNEIGNTLKNT